MPPEWQLLSLSSLLPPFPVCEITAELKCLLSVFHFVSLRVEDYFWSLHGSLWNLSLRGQGLVLVAPTSVSFYAFLYMAVASVLLDGKGHSLYFIFLVCGFLTWWQFKLNLRPRCGTIARVPCLCIYVGSCASIVFCSSFEGQSNNDNNSHDCHLVDSMWSA